MSGIAHFSGTLRRGVVYADDGTYVIEVDKPNQPELAGHTHLGMWMQGPDDIVEMDADAYPFPEVYQRMKEAADAARARMMAALPSFLP